MMIPCPYCGSESLEFRKVFDLKKMKYVFKYVCLDCGTEGPIARDGEQAKKLWDTRPVVE